MREPINSAFPTNLSPEELDALLTPEYMSADSGSRSLLIASYFMIFMTTIFLIFFFVSRYYNKSAIGTLMLVLVPLGYLSILATAILCILIVHDGGAGKHIFMVQPDVALRFAKMSKVSGYLYAFAIAFPKLAILALYLQIFHKPPYIWTVRATAIVITLNTLVFLLITTLICRPFSYFWDRSIPGGYCGNTNESYSWVSVPNLITDVIILVLPLPLLWEVQVSSMTKAGLLLTFLSASLGIIPCIIRLQAFFNVKIDTDPTFLGIRPLICTILEPSGYLVCAILPTMRHLQRRAFSFFGISSIFGSKFLTSSDGTRRASTANQLGTAIELKPTTRSGFGEGTHASESGIGKDRKGFTQLHGSHIAGGTQSQEELVDRDHTGITVTHEIMTEVWQKNRKHEVLP